MNSENVTPLTPSDEDPTVDRWLASLPEFAPRAGFEEAVMAQVRVPAPAWLRSVQTATRRAFAGKRLWWWAGGLATTTAASISVLLSVALTYRMQVETAWSLFMSVVVVELWRVGIGFAAEVLTVGASLTAFWSVNYKLLILASVAGALVTTGSLWGLYRVLSTNSERIAFDARR